MAQIVTLAKTDLFSIECDGDKHYGLDGKGEVKNEAKCDCIRAASAADMRQLAVWMKYA